MITSIVVDQREPQWVHNLSLGVPIVAARLDIGDALVSTDDNCILVIERKTPRDLCNSIGDNRLFRQCAELRKVSEWAYLVITGDLRVHQPTGKLMLDFRETGWDYSSIWGALATVQELGVTVILCKNDLDYGDTIKRLGARDRNGVKLIPKRDPLAVTPGENLLLQLPGIGYDKMTKLMKHCGGSAAWALNYLTTLGAYQVPGIGEGIKRTVIKSLGLEPGWELWPIQENSKEALSND